MEKLGEAGKERVEAAKIRRELPNKVLSASKHRNK